MALGDILLFLLLGALAGWIASLLMRGHGFGLLANMLIGIVGALIGGFLFEWLGVDVGGGFWAGLLTAIVGAALLLFVTGILGRISSKKR